MSNIYKLVAKEDTLLGQIIGYQKHDDYWINWKLTTAQGLVYHHRTLEIDAPTSTPVVVLEHFKDQHLRNLGLK